MAIVRLSAATLPWQCEIPEDNEGRSFGFAIDCSDQLPHEMGAHPHLKEGRGPLFWVRGNRDQTWTIESSGGSQDILFNGNPLTTSELSDGDILTIGEHTHLLVNIEGDRSKPRPKIADLHPDPPILAPGELKQLNAPEANAPKPRAFPPQTQPSNLQWIAPWIAPLYGTFLLGLVGLIVYQRYQIFNASLDAPLQTRAAAPKTATIVLHKHHVKSAIAASEWVPPQIADLLRQRQLLLQGQQRLIAQKFAECIDRPNNDFASILKQTAKEIERYEAQLAGQMAIALSQVIWTEGMSSSQRARAQQIALGGISIRSKTKATNIIDARITPRYRSNYLPPLFWLRDAISQFAAHSNERVLCLIPLAKRWLMYEKTQNIHLQMIGKRLPSSQEFFGPPLP